MAAATTVWRGHQPVVLPLTIALPAIHGARICNAGGRYPRLGWLDEPVEL